MAEAGHGLDRERGQRSSGRSSSRSTAAGRCSSPVRTASWARTSPRRSSCSARASTPSYARPRAGRSNNIGHLPPRRQGAFRRPDRPYLGRLPRPRPGQGGRPAVHLPPRGPGARRRVVAPAVRDADGEHGRHPEPAPVDRRPRSRDREVRHGGHVRGVRERPRAGAPPPRLRRRRRADPPRALADQPEVDLRDQQGRRRLPDDELPRRLRPADAGDADVQQLRPPAESRATSRARSSRRRSSASASSSGSSSRSATSASAPTACAAISPSRRTASPATSTSTARGGTSRCATGPTSSCGSARRRATGAGREVVSVPERFRPGVSEVMALRVGYEKLQRETGWEPKVSWEEGVSRTIALVRGQSRPLDRPRGLAAARTRAGEMSVLVTGGGGFLGSHLVERLRTDGVEPFVARRCRLRPHPRRTTRPGSSTPRSRSLVIHLAAEVGGIGANLVNGGRYWYANTMMGANVLEQSRLHEVDKLVVVGTICSYPKLAPHAVPRREPLGRVPRGDERGLRRGEEVAAGRRAGLPGAVRAQQPFTCSRSTSTARATTSISSARTSSPR